MFYLLEMMVLAVKNLGRYKMRTFLTTAGIIFGIGAVISMLSVGAGARGEILAQIRRMGITNIIVTTVKPPEEKKASGQQRSWVNQYGLTFRDADYLDEILEDARLVLRIHRVRKKVYFRNRVLEARVLGVEPPYFQAMNLPVAVGRPIHQSDLDRGRRVCVVGPAVLRELLYTGDPLDMDLRVGGEVFKVVGVCEEEGQATGFAEATSLRVFLPYETSLRRFGTFSITAKAGSREASEVELEQIVVSCRDVDAVLDTASVVASALKSFHEKRDYELTVPLRQLQQVKKTQQIFQVVMVLIASISLLVGGIGIANIMFATVTERTREIGVRRALGATRWDVLVQFLCETVVIALLGGVFGCAFGVLGVHLIQRFTGWESSLNPDSMVLALFISCLVGVLSGLAPARRAANFDPVASLRHE